MSVGKSGQIGVKMNISDFLVTVAQTSNAEQPGLFPFPFPMHLIFSIIALLFFIFRFSSEKQPYQLIMAIAVPFSLIIWVADTNRFMFYFMGAVELILLAVALVTSIIGAKKQKPAENGDGNKSDEEETE